MSRCHQFTPVTSRRDLLRTSACGFGQIALAGMAGQTLLATDHGLTTDPVIPVRAKRVIFLFMWGGPSHIDFFDPKPRLNELSGQSLNASSVGRSSSEGGDRDLGTLMGSPFTFSQHGESGIWMNELFPQLSKHADKMCVIRSLHTEGSAHGEALLRLHTGQANLVRPSVGAWVSYGLGSENENLPAFITISPPRGHGGAQNYGSAFLPAVHQGTAIGSAETPIRQAKISNLTNPSLSLDLQRKQLDLVQSINARHLQEVGQDRRLEGLIENYELAYRMQSTIPAIMDLSDETLETLNLYGVDAEPTDNFARQCLLARKFAEQGVRYIQVSTDYTWDHHKQVKEGSIKEAAKVDRPIAGLLEDLQRRGLLEDTLVVWGAEFGRTPTMENGDGRNHHPQAFTMWMAGGGCKPGLTYGATDEFGHSPVENPVHMHDLHATLLYMLGLDHEHLTYRHAGRDFRLTDVYGNVVHDILT
ncbi:DUF1501 domain-containing protein [Stieleria sp. ICT_E10.1]|uniref:DUF1501 domain-containing protein n=1 Tax=Stieleria sedimenti TaxID=2976331 RepID=UPI0021804DCF|nr:DUF1501 domain-containing protein [Stieleria sedimenti]MCS7465421.1 DUF1501 domain-containing protein [Stieleria sedimenti]